MDNTYHPGAIEESTGAPKGEPQLDTKDEYGGESIFVEEGRHENPADNPHDVFGREDDNDIKYKTLSWQMVSLIMITEIVSNGTLSLPSSLAAVGAVPGAIVILALGIFATYTSWALVQFKIRHPEGKVDTNFVSLSKIPSDGLSSKMDWT